MRKALGTIGAVAALCLLTAASASASFQFGKHCVGNATRANSTVLLLANGEHTTFSASAGPWELWGSENAVITRWRVQVGPGIAPPPQQLVAFNYPGESDLVVRSLGASAIETLVEGSNEFSTRIPIPAYAHIGLHGPAGTLYCEETSIGLIGVVEGDFPPGSIKSQKLEFPDGVPVVATLEADHDGDGYGDETQDGCVASALWHGPCPNVQLTSGATEARPGAILIQPWLNYAGRIAVSGSVSWKLPARKQGKANAATRARIRTVALDGGAQDVAAAVPAAFRVPLPKAVLKRLGKLSRQRTLTAKLTVLASGAPELEGKTMTRIAKVRLPGRAAPRR